MSCDFAVWSPDKRLNDAESGRVYRRLCDGITDDIGPNPAIDAFYEELTAKHPEIDDIPEEEIDNHDLCPWSIAMDKSPAHVIMLCVWSKADYVDQLIKTLARKHGLAVYDPQAGKIIYPDQLPKTVNKQKPWWRVW
jgi:hypothetical protein